MKGHTHITYMYNETYHFHVVQMFPVFMSMCMYVCVRVCVVCVCVCVWREETGV